jgi:hypothetical protein
MHWLRDYRIWRAPWALILFLLGFFALLVIVSRYYLLPAFAVMEGASPTEKKWLSAASTLLLAVVLFTIAVGLVLVFRVRRYFVPPPRPRTKTQYVDAWAESAKRMENAPPDDEEDGGVEDRA